MIVTAKSAFAAILAAWVACMGTGAAPFRAERLTPTTFYVHIDLPDEAYLALAEAEEEF